MGFYGNITNTGRTHFQFDKIFENRRAMDIACLSGTDNIFAGRFVLVSYDPESRFTAGDILSGFKINNVIYADASHTIQFYYTNFQQVQPSLANANNWNQYYWKYESYYIKLPGETYYNQADAIAGNYWTPTVEEAVTNENKCFVTEGQLIRIYNDENIPSETFYKCKRGEDGDIADWELVILSESYPNYLINYNIDKEFYGVDQALRGYDGTVWQKIYSEGKGKFILIARLNSLMPGLELFPDAPSVLPSAPYIDSKSSEVLYRIHVPSHWGLRFKEDRPVSDGGLSDQQVSTSTTTYDNQGNPSTQVSTYNASIYFNKAGFDKNKRSNIGFSVDDNTHETIGVPNELLLEPTGESGKTYYDSQGNPVKKDILELSLHLPAVGNMVSDGYDVIYGYDPQTQNRYTDVDWISGDRSDSDKYFGPEGKKTHDMRTIAGTLNTMHDTLGQIVIHLDAVPTSAQAANLRDGYIYEVNGNYYRRGIGYKKIIVEDYLYRKDAEAASHFNNVPYAEAADHLHYEETNQINENGNIVFIETTDTTPLNGKTYYYRVKWCTYERDPDASTQFTTNKYYVKDGDNFYPCENTGYNTPDYFSNYYLKRINPARFTPVTLLQYIENYYYYIDGENYIRDTSRTNDGPRDPYGAYYTLQGLTAKHFDNIYQANRYHKLIDGNYILQTELTPDPVDNDYYYLLTPSPAFTYVHPTSGETIHPRCIIYVPGVFYKKTPAQGVTSLVLAEENEAILPTDLEDMNQMHYYALEFSDETTIFQDPTTGQIYYAHPVKPGGYHDVTEYLQNRDYNEMTHQYINYYYKTTGTDGYSENSYILFENLAELFPDAYWIPRYYYTVGNPAVYQQDKFYLPGRYHVLNAGNYLKTYETYLDSNGAWTGDNIDFYYIQPANVVKNPYPFYRPNVYWYDTTGNETYERDESTTMRANTQYYEKTRLFVDYDTRHECPHGFEWSDYAPYIPPSITLYARDEYLAAVPLDKAYSGQTNLTTINDFLLYLNKSYDPDNDETRDLDTFRGVYNSIKDILYLIKKLEPGKVVYVNNFGQLTTGTKEYSDLP